jgi:hypothetical protein
MVAAVRPTRGSQVRPLLAFLGIFVALYAVAVVVAEATVARDGMDSPFQKLLAARGEDVDWVVVGASHALPLAYGDVPGRLEADTGQTMMVLAEVGSGPLYNLFVVEQAIRDLKVRHILYIVDAFAFADAAWNEERLSDRTLLRRTPLRLSTAAILARLTAAYGADPRGLADYLTGFSKLNPPDRFPQEGWRGAQDFDRRFRPSRHSVASRAAYLYPEGPPDAATVARYLNVLEALLDRAKAAGIEVHLVRLPIPDVMREALPDGTDFDWALKERLADRGAVFHDLGTVLGEPSLYFDTDHLNREGVDALYRDHLLAILRNR